MEWWKAIEPYIFILFPVVIVIAAVATIKRGRRARQSWQTLAQTYGLTYTPPGKTELLSKKAAIAFQDPGEITGVLEGLTFRLFIAIYGTSKDRRVYTIMSLEIPGLPRVFTLYHENAFLGLTKMVGAQDVKTGDEEFDKAFMVKGENPDEVLNWLTAERRHVLRQEIGSERDMDIREGCLRFEQQGVCDKREVLENALTRMRALIPYVKG